jgi:polyisoprenoid-binding protein YceI
MSTETTTTWTIDPMHAEVAFAVRHLMLSTVRGRFGAVTGTVQLDEKNPPRSTVDVTIDVGSIDTRQDMRDNHLRSPDFFDVANY